MNKLNMNITEAQKFLLNCVLYNELMMLEDRINSGDNDQREEILEEILDIKDLLKQIKGINE
jgi:hypothetical protein